MKEKIKNFMFWLLISYSVLFVIFFIFNMFSIRTKIELKDNDTNLKRYASLSERVSKLEESSCSVLLNEMIDAYGKTSFDGEIDLNVFYDLYWNGPSFLSFYMPIQEKCNMSSEVMSELGMPMDSINSITYVDNTIMNNMFNYELKIRDYAVRGIAEASISQLEYQTCKSSELDMIEKVLDYIGGKINE